MRELNTERLVIRPLNETDNTAWLEIFSSKKVGEFLPMMSDIEAINRSIAKKIKKFSENLGGSFSVILRENNKVIGNVELKIIDDSAELSYVFNDNYWSKGFCTEACVALINYAFTTLNVAKVIADCLSYNIASSHILTDKLHMKIVREEIPQNETQPFKFFELTKDDWNKTK